MYGGSESGFKVRFDAAVCSQNMHPCVRNDTSHGRDTVMDIGRTSAREEGVQKIMRGKDKERGMAMSSLSSSDG